jgi:GTPase SAR1 family protein
LSTRKLTFTRSLRLECIPVGLLAGPQDRTHLESEIRKAHVICVVYSIDNPQSFDRIPTFWLPHFRQLGVNVPVILVGNKIDLRGGEVTNEALEEEIVPIMNEFKVSRLFAELFFSLRILIFASFPKIRRSRRVLNALLNFP